MFKEINPREIDQNLIKMIADEWMLITAGDQSGYNMMTASWGFAGEMWGSDCVVAVVRPQRYTMEFLKNHGKFTLSFYGDNKEIHKVCGSKSGRDVDKTAETGLTPVFSDGTTYFDEARAVLICEKLYVQQMGKEFFITPELADKWYPQNDYHFMIVGKIQKALVK